MNALKGLIWVTGGFLLMAGGFAEVAFELQYVGAAHVLIVGALVFLALGIIADQVQS